MAEYDILIKGGRVVEGTGVPSYLGDVGIKDGRVAQVGAIRGRDADKVLDASGLIVAPGFVDLHTHYDAQIQWDPYCTISGWHGVTSVALGNCGFGFAPMRPELRERAMLMMERNEAIPAKTMRAGMLWDWVTFPEWMDSLDRLPKGVNCVQYFPVTPLMVWVMGLEASKSRPATNEERREMQRLLAEGMDAGACGWATQRLGEHSVQGDYDGTPMPSDLMTDEDMLALAEVLGERNEGFMQITDSSKSRSDIFSGDGRHNPGDAWIELIAKTSGRPIMMNVVAAFEDVPEFHRGRIEWLKDCQARGLRIFGQALSDRTRFMFTLKHWAFYDSSPAWKNALLGTVAERMQKLRDPQVRAQMKAEEDHLVKHAIGGPLEGFTVQPSADYPELERYRGRTVGEIAKDEGKDPLDALIDVAVASDLDTVFVTAEITSSDPDKVAEMMRSNCILPGISDGGAHTKFFVGGSYTTDTIAWLVRDTGRLTLEQAHHVLSTLPAHAAGFKDRGTLQEGGAADVVVYDLENLKRVPERDQYELAWDFPENEWRRVQRAEGYRWTIVNGEITFEDGKCTGATPGRLLRHGKAQ